MKKFSFLSFLTLLAFGSANAQQDLSGNQANALVPGASRVVINKQSRVPSFIVFDKGTTVLPEQVFDQLKKSLQAGPKDSWMVKNVTQDRIGFTHTRYTQLYSGYRVEDGEYIVHARNGKVESVNGMWMDNINVDANASVTEATALQAAMNFMNATTYRWQVPAYESQLKLTSNDQNATYFPTGELVVVCSNNDFFKKDYHFAWKFDVFAAQPVSRKYIYVDAHSGEVIASLDRICEADVPATGTTMYAGNVSFTCDNFASGQYRLRETARGLGIQTFNAQNSTNTAGAPDFTNNSTNWTTTANGDDAARDAHWGAEQTYDYYMNVHNRNGLDDAGLLMVSYVHYDSGLDNAYWDGSSMNYGDGTQQPGGFNPLVAIDVCGHEFSHGVTQFTCNLDYMNESGAMNESFSDIMGTAIEHYCEPATANFLIGEQITVTAGTALRDMQNPNAYGDPDTYNGTNWYTGFADNGGVHTNSGVRNHWFYIACQGETGTNDLGNPYNVTGIGIGSAADVCFRGQTVYLVNTSQYADCAMYDIQSAVDLFGGCSAEEATVANAWYACGVGNPYSPVVVASFTGDVLQSCSVPVTVNFTNTSANANNATWYFGDNTTSTAYAPSHTYTQAGTYTVSLSVNSTCGTDSTSTVGYINVNPPAAPTSSDVSNCASSSFTLNGSGSGTLNWFANPTGGTSLGSGNSFTTPVLNTTTTYYVENDVPQPPANVGPLDWNFGTGGQHNNTSTQYLSFDVYQNCTLIAGDVNAGSAGNKTFSLWDGSGNLIQNYTVNVPSTGANTIALNIPLTPGSYRIGGTQMNLYRNSTGAAYPYTIPGVLSIITSSADADHYYYLYNWQVGLPDCASPRTPVVCSIGALNVAFSTAGFDSVCVDDAPFTLTGGSPAGGTYSGPGVTGTTFDPATAGSGAHTITYTYTDSTSCTGSIPATIYVDVCAGVHSLTENIGVSVYPNPANDNLNVELQFAAEQKAKLELVDMLGEVVYTSEGTYSGNSTVKINTSSIARGVYLLSVRTANGTQIRKVELQ